MTCTVLDNPQGTPEWLRDRLGIPTASQFHRIVTPAKLKPASGAEKYLHELLAEWALDAPLEDASGGWLERGSEMEAQAVAWYEYEREVDAREVGLCVCELPNLFGTQIYPRVGASPDRLVGDDGGLELKCPSAKVHMAYLLGSVYDAYRLQVQGCLWVTGREWWDVLSFNPDLPKSLIRVERDEEVTGALAEHVSAFAERLEEAKLDLARRYPELRQARAERAQEPPAALVTDLLDSFGGE